MTNREFFNAIIEANVSEEVTEFATESIRKLDAACSRRKDSAVKKVAEREAEREPIRAALMAVMTNEFKTATTLIEEAGVEIKPQALPSLLKRLIEDGVVAKGEVKVSGKGTQRGYALI